MERKKNAYIEISIDPFERGTQTSTERQVNYSFLSLRERKAGFQPDRILPECSIRGLLIG